MLGKVVGTISTATGQVDIKLDGQAGLTVIFAGTFGNAAGVFEVSMDTTNGVNGTWFQIQGQRSNGTVGLENSYQGITNTQPYFWSFNVDSWGWFRVRSTALTSGVISVTLCPLQNEIVANNQVVHSNSSPQGRVRNTLALTLTSDVIALGAPGANRCTNLADLQAINTGAGPVDLICKEGGTVIWQLTLPVNVPVCIIWGNPLRLGANLPLNLTLSAAGTVRANVSGFISM